MTILLTDLLNDLREDHRNMAVMLDLLSRQVDRIKNGERPDYELIHDIMRYMTTYSDAVHHPKEDVLYSAMRAEKPETAKGLERVGPEHQLIAEQGERLRNDVEAVASGAPVTRDRLMHLLHEEFPAYGWQKNVGYPTQAHYAALAEHDPTPYHRRSFRLEAR